MGPARRTRETKQGPPAPRDNRPTTFDVWGCRGSRSLVPHRSAIGNNTSCYSIHDGEDVFALDAGRGVAALAHSLNTEERFRGVKRLHVLVTHAHVDHWEGLKDADWFWLQGNGLSIRILAPEEALNAIHAGYDAPSYVPLELLARGTISHLEYVRLRAGERRVVGRWTVSTAALNHYSGGDSGPRMLETVGYRLTARGGPTVSYLSDHEPSARTARAERRLVGGSHLAVYDSHFADVDQQMYGHGSQEHSARVARRNPHTLVLAGHHGPALSDAAIRAASRRHGRGAANFQLAVEGRSYVWDGRRRGFVLRRRAHP